ncbi:P-loop containing nucleoside triphosphate hydrolase protein [Morchella snyderi]|nr:P-loop containing nucleoside triphosphate hydrolase protein [Morchella snyderi]
MSPSITTTTTTTAPAAAPTHDGGPQKQKPIFLATHPRACSTAFERVMMTRADDALVCLHEPFGDAFYYGPERLGRRFDGEAMRGAREQSGFAGVTFADVVAGIEEARRAAKLENKRIFIKDITHYLLPPTPTPHSQLAPSLSFPRKGYGTEGEDDGDSTNPTVLPLHILRGFQFTFLIRHPRRAVPSYYRCCMPPLAAITGFDYFRPDEAGYRELRVFFEFLLERGVVRRDELCVVDADDLLDAPEDVMRAYCAAVGLDFRVGMLRWGEGGEGCEKFDKWKGFHEDAIGSVGLSPRGKKQEKTEEEEYQGWVQKYGKEGADLIRETAEKNLEDYEFLKQFKMVV